MVRTDRRRNLLLGLDLEVQGQRAELQLVSQRGRRLRGEVTADLCLTVRNDGLHRRSGNDCSVEDDRERVTIRAASEGRPLGVRIVVAVQDRGGILELLGTIVVELQRHDPLAGRLTVIVARDGRGRRRQVRTGNGYRAQDVLDLAGLIAGGVGLICGALDALDIGRCRAIERQEVIHDLLGHPGEIRSVLGSLQGGVGQDAVAVRVRSATSGRLVQSGGLNAGLGRVSRSSAALLTRLLAALLAGLRTRLSAGLLTRLRVIHLRLLLILGDALRGPDAQHRAEVHLRGRTDQVQLLLGGGAGNRHHNVRATHRGDFGLGHAGGVNTITNNRDRLRDVLLGDLALSL